MANIPKIGNLVLRGMQFLWAVLIMALAGNMIASAFGGNHSIINYSMFCAVFAMISLIYLILGTIREGWSGHPMIMVIVDALNALFFLCGGIAMAAYLGAHSCSNENYTRSNPVTNGEEDTAKRCREAQAVCAFLWFGFVAFAASAVLSGLQSRGGANMRSGGIRRSGPAMSQV